MDADMTHKTVMIPRPMYKDIKYSEYSINENSLSLLKINPQYIVKRKLVSSVNFTLRNSKNMVLNTRKTKISANGTVKS